MTKSEQFRKSRAWLKIHSFVITKSLREKLKSVPLEDRAGYCYIQNHVLICADQYEEDDSARIPSDVLSAGGQNQPRVGESNPAILR